MKKIIIFCISSVFVVFTSLFYLNFVLLVDSSVISAESLKFTEEEGNIAFLPKGFSSCDFSEDYSKLVLLNKNLVYLVDLNKKESVVLKDLSFVEDVSFLDKDTLLFVNKDTNSIIIKKYSISEKNIEVLGDLSFRYFTRLDNVRYDSNSIYFDIEYLKDGISGSKSYIYKDGNIKSFNKQNNIIKYLNIGDNLIYTTESYITYINNSIFKYNDSSNFEIVGKDTDNILYLKNKTTNSEIMSLNLCENIEILNSYDLKDIAYKEILCTDSIYVIADDFVYDIKENKMIPFNQGHILLIANDNIYYEKDGEILYRTIIGR